MVALQLANVFAWDIDFVLDIREGDRFTAVYEQIYQDGKYLRDGELLAAEFVNSGKVYRAVRFAADTGYASYYTPDGLPMRKAFLRAPVEFTRGEFGVQSAAQASNPEPHSRTHGYRLRGSHRYAGACGGRRPGQLRGQARRLRQCTDSGPQTTACPPCTATCRALPRACTWAPMCSRVR